MEIRNFFSTFNTSAAGLSSAKNQLAVTAENIANATTTRTNEGTPYQRKYLLKQAIKDSNHFGGILNNARLKLATSNGSHLSSAIFQPQDVLAKGGAYIKNEVQESDHFKEVYDPNHPDADEQGIVKYPDINVVTEMLELITASRMYEANITVMNATKNVARRSLEI